MRNHFPSDCGIITSDGRYAAATVTESLEECVPHYLVLVTVLAHQAAGTLPSLRRSASKSIHFLFNTFYPKRIQDSVSLERAVLGMPFTQSNIEASGHINAFVGQGGQRTLTTDPKWVKVFQSAGMPARVELEMALWLRCHVPVSD